MKNFLVTPDLYASYGNRFANYIIDGIGYYILAFVVGLLLGVIELIGLTGVLDYIGSMGVLGNLIFTITLWTFYFSVFEFFTQKTLGKFITKTMVVMEDGSTPTTSDYLKRSFSRMIPFEAFSFLGAEGRGWHDTISQTYVVDIDKFEAKRKSHSELDQIGVIQDT